MKLKGYSLLMTFLCVFLCSASLLGQYTIRGFVQDTIYNSPIAGVAVTMDDAKYSTITDDKGQFELLNIPNGSHTIRLSNEGFVEFNVDVKIEDTDINLGTIELIARQEVVQLENVEDFIPIVTLSDEDLEQETDNQNISGILSASRDVFVSAAAFTFGPLRFRIGGLDSENTTVLFNNIPMNDLEIGRIFWSAWGGLNDVTRIRDTDVGIGSMPYTFGGLGGGSIFDTRASVQRKQLRVSVSSSNRSYRNRLMATYSTGMLSSGWAFSLSGSRRWAEEGFIDGTFYDSYAYFLSVDRRINRKHSLNFTGFGAPTKRGRSSATTQEMYDIAGSNYYNPNWGYQNGKKRNARVADRHEPMLILRHDWQINENASLTTAASYQFGKNGSTALDWFDAPDPRPDYYRNMPSFFLLNEEDDAAAIIFQQLQSSEAARQVNWHSFYDINRTSQLTDKYDYLLEGQTFSGNWSQYIIEERRFDNTRINFNTNYQNTINDQLTVHFGASYQQQSTDSYKLIDDLLGGDFYVNVDRFAVRDSIGNPDAQRNDLNDSEIILQEGDRYGYSYESNIQKGEAWLQGVFTLRKIDFFLGASVSNTQFWRTGNFQNGRFPNTSLGDSEKQNFTNFGVKTGLTYKISGRHFVYANGLYSTRAPFMRNSFVSPRTRNQVVPGLTSETIYGGEIGYLLRSPNAKARVTGYFNQFEDQIRILRFYNDINRAFGNYVINGVDRRHAGVELALEVKISPALRANAVAGIGQYYYSSNATGSIYLDNQEVLGQDATNFEIFQENFYISGMPQEAYTFGLSYNSRQYWFANLNFNYFRNSWIDFSPVRRTAEAVVNLDPNSQQFRDIIDQENAGDAFTIDFFGGKSFKFGRHFLYINIGVSNILDETSIRTGGFEQLRFDNRERNIDSFPPRYYYAFGRNYFINLSYRL